MHCQILLADKKIDYQLKRSRRRTIGLKINHQGLHVSAPFELSTAEIRALLQTKADWILRKLASWQLKTPSNPATKHGNGLHPLLGGFWKPEILECGNIQMVPATSNNDATPSDSNSCLPGLTPEHAQKWIMAWYQQQAISCFSERITLYAHKLNVPKPPFKLSQARTRWGSCNSRGLIRLNWRLVQLPLHLIDYVVAHEVAHLIEMNHSRAFWSLVEGIYPNYQQARGELKKYV